MAYDKNAYNNKYKKEKYDHFAFYAPKGTREKLENAAKNKGMCLAEFIRSTLYKEINEDTP